MNDERPDKHESEKRIQNFIKALDNLTDQDRKALRLAAHRLLSGSTYESTDDLLHEAIHRSIIDSRKWKDGVHIAVFLFKSMSSIASVDRKRATKLESIGKRHLPFEEWSMEDQLSAMGRWNLSPEEILIFRERIDELERARDNIRERLAGDSEALAIFEARSDEEPIQAIKSSLGLNAKRFKAADERARQAQRREQQGRP